MEQGKKLYQTKLKEDLQGKYSNIEINEKLTFFHIVENILLSVRI